MTNIVDVERELTQDFDENLKTLIIMAERGEFTRSAADLILSREFIHHYREPNSIHIDYLATHDITVDNSISHVETTAMLCYFLYNDEITLQWIGEEATVEVIELLTEHFTLTENDHALEILTYGIIKSNDRDLALWVRMTGHENGATAVKSYNRPETNTDEVRTEDEVRTTAVRTTSEILLNEIKQAREIGRLTYNNLEAFQDQIRHLPEYCLTHAIIASLAQSLKMREQNVLSSVYSISLFIFSLSAAEANDVEALVIDKLSNDERLFVYYRAVTTGSTLVVEYLDQRIEKKDENIGVHLAIRHDQRKVYELLAINRNMLKRDLILAVRSSAFKIIQLLWQDVENKEAITPFLLEVVDEKDRDQLASYLILN